jgi:hypothetical protein
VKAALRDAVQELRNPATWGIFACVVLIFLLGQVIDTPSEISTELAVFEDLLQAQSDSIALMHRESAGLAHCRALHGESTPLWGEDGQLSGCESRKGKKVAL